jgi:hypothetical protein
MLNILRMKSDFRGRVRTSLGVSPYARRSPLLLAIFNLRELKICLADSREVKSIRSVTRALRNSKTTRQALVLGNGPSLSSLNSQKVNLDHPDIWVVNDFYKVEQAEKLAVTHYVLSDLVYFSGLPEAINIKLNPVLEYVKRKNATLVLPHWAKGFELITSRIQDVYYFDDRELSAWSSNTSPIKPRGYIGLTLYKGLAFALYLGYKRIYILGMDNSEFVNYSSDSENRIFLQGNHAYSNNGAPNDLSDHYLDGMSSVFSSLSHAFGDLSKFHGPIVNLDGNSLTTNFPKILKHSWLNGRQKDLHKTI